VFVIVGATSDGRWLGPLTAMIKAVAYSPFVRQDFVSFFSTLNKEDLTVLRDFIQAGKVTPVIDRRYASNEIPAAIRYLENGHARGKVVVTFE
jgi:NADPH:quinone reductase-like Zn-dependent oxidoreductase